MIRGCTVLKKPTISVITAFYEGHRYLPELIRMFRANVVSLGQAADAEYLIVNDSPWKKIDLSDIPCDDLNIRVLENPENYGIHKTRVQGVCAAKGEYILILDQDDLISDTYLRSQLECIGVHAIAVCNGYKETPAGKKRIYRDRLKMSLTDRKNFYLLAANQIVSPGQCLIRKAALPDAWLETLQAINGADDLFLWLLMLSNGVRFAKNYACLYTHRDVGSNLSKDLSRMCQSDMETCRLLRTHRLLPEKDIRKRERLCDYLKACGYRNRGNLLTMLRYPDVVFMKILAYYI